MIYSSGKTRCKGIKFIPWNFHIIGLHHTQYMHCGSTIPKPPNLQGTARRHSAIWIHSKLAGFTAKAQLSAQHIQSCSDHSFWSVLEEQIFLSMPEPLSGAAICQAVWWDKYSERKKIRHAHGKRGAYNNWRRFVKTWLHDMTWKHKNQSLVLADHDLHAHPTFFLHKRIHSWCSLLDMQKFKQRQDKGLPYLCLNHDQYCLESGTGLTTFNYQMNFKRAEVTL